MYLILAPSFHILQENTFANFYARNLFMKYTFMQKNNPIMDVDMNTYLGDVEHIYDIHDTKRLPLSVQYHDHRIKLDKAFQEWINYRNIPKTRALAGSVFKDIDVKINSLSLKSLGLNLNDQYWFRPYGSSIQWEDVNFFQNDFTGHPLGLSFKNEITTWEPPSGFSPDFSSNGNLPKFWFIENNTRFLAKEGKRPYYQQIPNEIIASQLLEKAGLPHVKYTFKAMNHTMYSICPTFITPDTEYIPAYEILNVIPYKKQDGKYNHFLACAKQLKIPHVKHDLDAMLQFDYVINNTDRHFGNFGFIRNVNTLQFLGMAPIFDNGNSLWFDSPIELISRHKQPAYPFAENQDKQVKLTDLSHSWITKLSDDDIANIIHNEFAKYELISNERSEKIIKTVLELRNYMILYQKQRQ